MKLDHELRQALSRKNPPAGFDHRVMDRIRIRLEVPSVQRLPRRRQYLLSAAAAVMLIVGGVYGLHELDVRRASARRAAAERATVEVTLALRIASDKLSGVQTKLQEFNRHE